MTLGQRLRFYRQRRLLTQVELASLIGTSQHAVSRWERDAVRPRPATMRQLCTALGVEPPALLDDAPGVVQQGGAAH